MTTSFWHTSLTLFSQIPTTRHMRGTLRCDAEVSIVHLSHAPPIPCTFACASTTHPCTPVALSRRLTPIHAEGTSAMAPQAGDVSRCVECPPCCACRPTADTVCGRAQARVRSEGWAQQVWSSLRDRWEGWKQARGVWHPVVHFRSVFGCVYIVNWSKMHGFGHGCARMGGCSAAEGRQLHQRGTCHVP